LRGWPTGLLVRGARDVDDEFGPIVWLSALLDVEGAVAVQELVGDVRQNGGTARGDAAFRDEDQESGEELVDLGGRLECGELPEEFDGEVVRVGLDGLRPDMPETETGLSVQDAETALAPVAGVMAAARGIVFGCDRRDFIGVNAAVNFMGDCGAVNAGAGFSCFLVHFCSSKGVYTPVAIERARKCLNAKELRNSLCAKECGRYRKQRR